ncbi:hypothetical protein [Novipirellula rosea]
MMLKLAGGGIYTAGKICFDANGNRWSGQNWMARLPIQRDQKHRR